MNHGEANRQARQTILRSIRDHLAASTATDTIYNEIKLNDHVAWSGDESGAKATNTYSLVDLFRESLEAVDGHCIVVESEAEAVQALRGIISDLRETPLRARRIALSDAPLVQQLVSQLDLDFEDVSVVKDAGHMFSYDVGITSAQKAIAETGTLVLDSNSERHRLASLLPPVHIAIIDASQICLTLGEALAHIHQDDGELSATITFITGPSRTADIELTLAIGVHGPQRLYVIVNL
ncbi:MAG TPA: lactate utilization protein [Pyrinomonadaceae bacterium]|nr:lactate utilization protein [Pyrinomonadaceae bacterium]